MPDAVLWLAGGHRALIPVDEGLLGVIDQAVHEMGVAIGGVPPVEYMSNLLRDLLQNKS